MIFLVLKWIGIMLINLLGFLTAPIIFPIAYALRNIKFVRNKLLWIYYDDEDGFGWNVDWWAKSNNYKENFWTAYKWCAIRNPAWNLQALFTINYNKSYMVYYRSGLMQKNGSTIYPEFYNNCVLKYVDKYGQYMDNKGDFLSLRHSIIGKSFVIYYLNNKKHWKFSYANKISKNLWCEIQIGFMTRATFRFKLKTIKNIW